MIHRLISVIFIFTLIGCSSRSPETERQKTVSSQLPDTLSMNLDYASSRADSSRGQTIYVPVYSHIYQQNHEKTFNLTATLSVRNTDLRRPFTLTKVLYYDSQGKLVKNYLENDTSVGPLASTSFVVEENDLRGGVGANFIVQWKSDRALFPPVVEAVMISTSQQQGISFVSHGRVLEEQSADSLSSK